MKKYESPEIEISAVETTDIITASGEVAGDPDTIIDLSSIMNF